MIHEVAKVSDSRRIGLYSSSVSRDSRSRGMDMTRAAVSPHGNGVSAISRSMSRKPAGARRRHAKTISVLVVCAVAGIFISAIALASVGNENAAHIQAPGIPHSVIGYIYDPGGAPVDGASVNITNLRTGEYDNTSVTMAGGFYAFDLNDLPSAYEDGDSVSAVAWLDPLSGDNRTIITTVGPYDWLNVTLGTVWIPEFPMVILPISGMLVLFAVVSLRRRNEAV